LPPQCAELQRDPSNTARPYFSIAKASGSMVQDQKSYGLDEHQFTQLATEHAQRLYLNDRPDVAFLMKTNAEKPSGRSLKCRF
jgi:hypothetical protein